MVTGSRRPSQGWQSPRCSLHALYIATAVTLPPQVLALPPAQCQSCLHQSWSCCHYVPQAETTPCSRLDPGESTPQSRSGPRAQSEFDSLSQLNYSCPGAEKSCPILYTEKQNKVMQVNQGTVTRLEGLINTFCQLGAFLLKGYTKFNEN